jgi:hypothetical protein
MSAWFEISLQAEFWVPLAGWDQWVQTRDLAELEPGVERLEISLMTPEHRLRAAALLLSHAAETTSLSPAHSTAFDNIALNRCGVALVPADGSETAVLQRFKVAHRVLAHTPLCDALLGQPSLVAPSVSEDLITDLTCALHWSPAVGALVEDLRSGNDALTLRALRDLAHLNKRHRSTLLDTLLCNGVLLQDALTLRERVLNSPR